MKNKLLFLIAILFSVSTFAQSAEEYYSEKALEYFNEQVTDSALFYAEKAIGIFSKKNIKQEYYVGCCFIAARIYLIQENIDKSIYYYSEFIDNFIGEKDDRYNEQLLVLAKLYSQRGESKNAEELLIKSKDLCVQLYGTNNMAYINCLLNLSDFYRETRNDKLVPTMEEIVLKYETLVGPEDLNIPFLLNVLGVDYINIGSFHQSLTVLNKAAKLLSKQIGKTNLEYYNIVRNIAICYNSLNEKSKADFFFREALAITKVLKDSAITERLMVTSDLAHLCQKTGDILGADGLYKELWEISKQKKMDNSLEFAGYLNEYGVFLKDCSRFNEAEEVLRIAIGIRKSQLGENSFEFAITADNLSLVMVEKGMLNEAEELNLKALKAFQNNSGKESLDFLIALKNEAFINIALERYEVAENIIISVLETVENKFPNNNLMIASLCTDLALSMKKQGNYDKALTYYKRAMKVFESTNLTSNDDYLLLLINYGMLFEAMGQIKEATELLKRGEDIHDKFFKADHLFASIINLNLAVLALGENNFAEANKRMDKVQNIFTEFLSYDHPNYKRFLSIKSQLYWLEGDFMSGFTTLLKVLQLVHKDYLFNLAGLTEFQKIAYVKNKLYEYYTLLSYCSKKPEFISAQVYERFLVYKGIVLSSVINSQKFLSSIEDTIFLSKAEQWKNIKNQLSKLYSVSISMRERYGIDIDSLEYISFSMEKELGRLSSTFKDFVMIPDFKWEDVKKNLKPDEAVVDIVKYRFYDKRWTDTTRYGVFVTRYDTDNEPVYFEFEEGNRIDTLVIPMFSEKNKNRFALMETKTDEENVIVLNQNTELDFYSELFAPLAKHLKGIKKIFFSLDGEFFKVNFNTIKNPETNKYLMEEYEIVYLSSANELAKEKTGSSTNKTAVLAGFPNYDLSLDSLTTLTKKNQDSNVSRDIYVNTSKIKKYNLDLLPGTKDEVTVTTDMLKKNGWTVESWLFNEATESNLKNVKAPGVISISTHGYFSQAPKEDYKDNFFVGTETQKAIENPLLRSGLFLTGAETFLNADDEQKEKFEENGILTAYEASQLNLIGTDLVILSACETGLGEVNNGEGVFGLQRGFLGAGAKSVLMSLWKVDDSATKDLMIEFMRNYSSSMDKQKSLRDAQLTIMKKYPQPYYWGAFVMVGL